MTKQRMRRGEAPPAPEAAVLRGGSLDRDLLTADAETNFDSLVADLIAPSLELWDTGQSPHYDLVYLGDGDADALVDAVIVTHSTTLINPHHDPDGSADR